MPDVYEAINGQDGLEAQELIESPVVLAMEAAFVADEELEGVGLFGFGFKSDAETGGIVHLRKFLFHFLFEAGHAELEGGGFGDPEAALAPFGDDHFLDEILFGGGGGLEVVAILLQIGKKEAAVFHRKDDGFGGHSMGNGIKG